MTILKAVGGAVRFVACVVGLTLLAVLLGLTAVVMVFLVHAGLGRKEGE